MSKRLAVLSAGIWRLREPIKQLTGYQPVRYLWPFKQPRFDAIAAWGRKPSADKAYRLGKKSGMPLISIEDGFLRSVSPGPEDASFSFVIDKTGIYYDATRVSDLEGLIQKAAKTSKKSPAQKRAREGIKNLRRLALSKYNNGKSALPDVLLAASKKPGKRVLVIDQTENDASIFYGLANAQSFEDMLAAAVAENPDAEIIVKLHPEVAMGRKRGYLDKISQSNIQTISSAVNPWTLIDIVDKVYVVSSQFGFEALLAGCKVICFGAPFYAGWGLTDDRISIPRRIAKPSLEQLFAAVYFEYSHYISPYTNERISFEQALGQLGFLRDKFHENDRLNVCIKISRWKRDTINRFITGSGGRPVHRFFVRNAVKTAQENNAQIVTWATKCTPKLVKACRAANVPLVRIEDGFLRSVGLGAAYISGASISYDTRSIYYDAHNITDLEWLLEHGDFHVDLVKRARKLRREIIEQNLTKYNVGDSIDNTAVKNYFPKKRQGILVPGQVEDDANVRETISNTVLPQNGESINLALLRAVRKRHEHAYIIYKPHPDVVAGLRKGKVSDREVLGYADRIVSKVSILRLIEQCDSVELLSSLTGFEALLRGKSVTTHGLPFYAGWGLTTDFVTTPRRTAKRTLDELCAASLIMYARYLDPVSRLRCQPELIVQRLSEQRRNT